MCEVQSSIPGQENKKGSGNTESVKGNHPDKGNGRDRIRERVVGMLLFSRIREVM